MFPFHNSAMSMQGLPSPRPGGSGCRREKSGFCGKPENIGREALGTLPEKIWCWDIARWLGRCSLTLPSMARPSAATASSALSTECLVVSGWPKVCEEGEWRGD